MKIILLAIRPLMRFRTYTFVNVLGLALSLACVIIISRYVYSELQTDRFYPDLERIYTTIYEDDKHPGQTRYAGVSNPNNEKSFSSILEHPGWNVPLPYGKKTRSVAGIMIKNIPAKH